MDNIFKTNIVFGSMPIGNPYDISLNNIIHINNADILLVEHKQEFYTFIERYNKIKKNNNIFPNISINAEIYEYNLENDDYYCYQINKKLINLSNNKKILCLSDEGSSIFLEPFNSLKHLCIQDDKDFSVLPGANSVISALTNSIYNFSSFIFLGTFDTILNNENKKNNIIKILNKNNLIETSQSCVFLINGPQMLDGAKFLYENFDSDWLIDFSINLTSGNETHFYSTLKNFYDTVNSNPDFFINYDYTSRFAIVLFSKKYDYIPSYSKYYNQHLNNNFIFKSYNIYDE